MRLLPRDTLSPLTSFDPSEHPHRRFNPLTDEWTFVAPHRTRRPWQGQVEIANSERRPEYEPECYLCPGNRRAGNATNPDYADTFVFDNDFAPLLPDAPYGATNADGLLISASESGICRVVCFSPRHDLTLADMDVAGIRRVVDVWTSQYAELGSRDFINHVQIFENKGALMGCSNAHPHGQIWAQQSIPGEPAREMLNMRRHFEHHGTTLLSDYLAVELERKERIVCQNAHFVALVPFWAVWPFEIMILCRRSVANLLRLEDEERDSLSDIIRRVTVRYDNLFQCSFPYSAGLHQAPTDGDSHPEWDLHMHFYPPLLRSATVKKFMVGYEMLAEAQRDVTPEVSAARLRELPDTHYTRA